MTPAEYAKKAAALIEGERGRTHGDYHKQHRVLARLWQVYLEEKFDIKVPLTALDAAQMMVQLKESRTIVGLPIEDHYVDQIGYAAIAGAINDRDKGDFNTKDMIYRAQIREARAENMLRWDPVGLDGKPLPGWEAVSGPQGEVHYVRAGGETQSDGKGC